MFIVMNMKRDVSQKPRTVIEAVAASTSTTLKTHSSPVHATRLLKHRPLPGSTRGPRIIWGALAANSLLPDFVSSLILAAFFYVGCSSLHATEVIPPKPDRYFNDYAHVVSAEAGLRFNEQLAQLERDNSAQIVVAVFPKMQTDSSIDDYTRRIAQAWDIGQKQTQNGVALFVFIADRKMFIQTAHGVEGALPDATCFDITERHIKPEFRAGNYERGLAIGIDLIGQALRGEYKGTGKTVKEGEGPHNSPGPFIIFFIIFLFFIINIARRRGKKGYRYSGLGGPFMGGWSSGSGGGGWSSGSDGGGFSGFSGGGGGGFGGGGAGSGW